ncbi:hypothetical protein DPX16_8700 [Anabarilius grahami]|uniref:Uncharacterized protein n=1 Tax=Anabarilius grahami TaxID=495550 RepID=A0A3N0YES2_ANAGA|nr:hypothetical protein DPX16_8700 [Anabarilius grahami]
MVVVCYWWISSSVTALLSQSCSPAPEWVDRGALPPDSDSLGPSTCRLHLRLHQTPSAFQLHRVPSSHWHLLGQSSRHLRHGLADLPLHYVPPPLWLQQAPLSLSGLPRSSITPESPQSLGSLAPPQTIVTTASPSNAHLVCRQCRSPPSALRLHPGINRFSLRWSSPVDVSLHANWFLPPSNPPWAAGSGSVPPDALYHRHQALVVRIAPSPHHLLSSLYHRLGPSKAPSITPSPLLLRRKHKINGNASLLECRKALQNTRMTN